MSTLLISIILAIFCVLAFSKIVGTKWSKLPPGPKPWPIIGNLHQLGSLPHRTLADMSKKYGPIMCLKLGMSMTTIVISSPQVAKEMFVKHDLTCSSRSVPCSATVANHDKLSVVWLPVSPKWRDLRKILTIQLLTTQRLDATRDIRQRKVEELVAYARHCSENGFAVDVGKAGFTTTLNLLSNTIFSTDLAAYDSASSEEFKELVWNLLEETARPNMSDLFPFVKHFDLQGVMRRITIYFNKMIGIFEKIIDERLQDETKAKDDVLNTVLKLVKDNELSLEDFKHLLVDLFAAGTETSSNTLEWAMTELLRNPEKMAKVQNELEQVVGKKGSIEESDISKLPYLQAIVKETLRLHPPAPFLVPHKAEKDVELCGYHVPRNAQLWVNIWAIGRDPLVWSDPSSFKPERFLEREIDVKGRDFELIPFGAGRRLCPGYPLAYRMLHLMLATLLHTFNWKYCDGVNDGLVDVKERFALSLQRARPLLAIPSQRQFLD